MVLPHFEHSSEGLLKTPNEIEISDGQGVVANTLNLFPNGAVGFIDWLDAQSATSVMSKDRHDCDEPKPRAKQEQTESGAANLSDCEAAFARLNRKCKV
jgi:hypothetical protein